MSPATRAFRQLGELVAATGGRPPLVELSDELFAAMRREQLIDDHNTVRGCDVYERADGTLHFNRWAVVVRHFTNDEGGTNA